MEHPSVQAFMAEAERRNPHEAEFIQAVEEVAETIIPFIEANPRYQGHALLERMIEWNASSSSACRGRMTMATSR